MFLKQTKDEQISEFIEDIQINDNSFKKRLVSILAEMTEVNRNCLKKWHLTKNANNLQAVLFH